MRGSGSGDQLNMIVGMGGTGEIEWK